jgi:esterase/lipase superfamily enzyme
VVLTALRELHLYCRGAGLDTARELKLSNLVLAAPDLDLEVVNQRVDAEQLYPVSERMTIYISPDDKALWAATWLFDSVKRLGRLLPTDLTAREREDLRGYRQLQLIDARVRKTDFVGHGYFYRNPSVSSDLILMLRDDLDAGEQNGRPLIDRGDGFWELYDGYPDEQSLLQRLVSGGARDAFDD